MSSRSSSALKLAIAAIPVLFLACGKSNPKTMPDASMAAGSGGNSIATGGNRQGTTSSPAAIGGSQGGATRASGGTVGAGSASGTGGGPSDTGGVTGTGGTFALGGASATGGSSNPGGASATRGTARASGGTPGAGGSILGGGGNSRTGGTSSGGATASSGGAAGQGGVSGTGGVAAGGATATSNFPPKFVGNIDARNAIPTDFVKYWNQFTPENAGKWASVQGTSADAFSWTWLDAMYKYCEENHILFKEHSFVWGAAQAGWLQGASIDIPTAVRRWMKTFCDRYPNTRLIDVVNEPPPHTTPFYVNEIGGGTNTTWDWIANSFKWAHDACPNAILMLNDYNNVELASDVKRTIAIVNAIQKLGAPIHAIGCQTHGAQSLPSSTLKANIDLIASSTGLPVYITEYDINLADDAKQKAQYEDHVTMFMSNPNVKGVTIWGYIQGATWETNTWLLAGDGSVRPAMAWLMNFLAR